jgi:anti-sigma regulatory factor (Ser/Thr protein kinase)
MSNKQRGEKIRRQILRDVKYHPSDIVRHISQLFTITPQAVGNHIQRLEKEGYIESTGARKGKRYFLGDIRNYGSYFKVDLDHDEYKLWREHFSFVTEGLKENIYDICQYGFTEMVNNVIDHSGGKEFYVRIKRTSDNITIDVVDFGEGIFKRIKRMCNLGDERESLLELSKGKFTTDPDHHSGEGIFFTSRAFDEFFIDSKGLQFTHNRKLVYDFFDVSGIGDGEKLGTHVFMRIARDSERDLNSIYQEFGIGPDDYRFSKTIIPVRLAQYDDDKLVSRSQAKRLLSGLEKFQNIILNFEGVPSIGQSFADEIFRVYKLAHPEKILLADMMNPQVELMVNRVSTEGEGE